MPFAILPQAPMEFANPSQSHLDLNVVEVPTIPTITFYCCNILQQVQALATTMQDL